MIRHRSPDFLYCWIFHASGPLPENGQLGLRLGANGWPAWSRFSRRIRVGGRIQVCKPCIPPEVRPLAVEMMHDSLPWAKRITAAGARIFRENRWGEILGKLPFWCLKPAFLGENVGESQFYPVLKPGPTAAFPATKKAQTVKTPATLQVNFRASATDASTSSVAKAG